MEGEGLLQQSAAVAGTTPAALLTVVVIKTKLAFVPEGTGIRLRTPINVSLVHLLKQIGVPFLYQQSVQAM